MHLNGRYSQAVIREARGKNVTLVVSIEVFRDVVKATKKLDLAFDSVIVGSTAKTAMGVVYLTVNVGKFIDLYSAIVWSGKLTKSKQLLISKYEEFAEAINTQLISINAPIVEPLPPVSIKKRQVLGSGNSIIEPVMTQYNEKGGDMSYEKRFSHSSWEKETKVVYTFDEHMLREFLFEVTGKTNMVLALKVLDILNLDYGNMTDRVFYPQLALELSAMLPNGVDIRYNSKNKEVIVSTMDENGIKSNILFRTSNDEDEEVKDTAGTPTSDSDQKVLNKIKARAELPILTYDGGCTLFTPNNPYTTEKFN